MFNNLNFKTLNQILPTGFTPENLAEWLEKNHKDTAYRTDKHEYTEEEIAEFALAAMEKGKEVCALEELINNVKDMINGGNFEDKGITIPRTVGLKKLTKQRDSFYEKARLGYEELSTKLYGIPDSEALTMRFFDIEGNEDVEKATKMTDFQIEKYGSPLFKAARDFHDGLAEAGMKVEGVSEGGAIVISETKKIADFSDPINEVRGELVADENGEISFESKEDGTIVVAPEPEQENQGYVTGSDGVDVEQYAEELIQGGDGVIDDVKEEETTLSFDGERVKKDTKQEELFGNGGYSSEDDEINAMDFKI